MPTPPSRGGVSSPFGMRVNPNDGVWRMHYGEDTLGDGNYAPATGTVVFAGWDRTGTGLGWAVGVRETLNPSVIWWVAHHGSTSLWNPLKVTVGSKVSERFTYLGPKGSTGAAKGIHCHTERRVGGEARPGSGTATNPRAFYGGGGVAGGGLEPIEEEERDHPMRIIYNQDSSDDATRRAIVGELSFEVITGPQSVREEKLWGAPVNFTVGEWNACRDLVILRRKELGLPVSLAPNGSVDPVAVQAAARAGASEAVAGLDIPSAAENGAAAREAIVRPA